MCVAVVAVFVTASAVNHIFYIKSLSTTILVLIFNNQDNLIEIMLISL